MAGEYVGLWHRLNFTRYIQQNYIYHEFKGNPHVKVNEYAYTNFKLSYYLTIANVTVNTWELNFIYAIRQQNIWLLDGRRWSLQFFSAFVFWQKSSVNLAVIVECWFLTVQISNGSMDGIQVRIYDVHSRVENSPALIWIHGGGWTTRSPG